MGKGRRRRNRPNPAAAKAADPPRPGRPWGLALGAGAVAALATLHTASVFDEFRLVAGLHRWLMTYAEGFHRRGLVGTLFQAVAGDESRDTQVALASQVSTAGLYLWLAGALALLVFAAARVRDRAVMALTLAFGAFAFLNPMWTTRAHDNGYLDWLVGLAVTGALAAFVLRRPLVAGALAAVGIVAYWGTLFVWLPLGFLGTCLLLRDAGGRENAQETIPAPGCAMDRRRAIAALALPPAAALLAALFHDNEAAIAQLQRIGGQANIIEETFSGIWPAVLQQAERVQTNGRAMLGIATVFLLPPALCAAFWTCALRRLGRSLLQPAWLDAAAAVLATLAPVSFLVVAFDMSRLMAWTYFAFFAVMVVWLAFARPVPEARRGGAWPWAVAPVALAAFFWTSPTIYAWADLSHMIPCERFCFKVGTLQGRLLDGFRRHVIASPIQEYSTPGGMLRGTTGHNEKHAGDRDLHRVARAGRDQSGRLMDLNVLLGKAGEGVTLQAPAQTKNAIIGSGAHRISIAYRAGGTDAANASTHFLVYDRTFGTLEPILRARLPASETEFTAIVTPPPELAGNPFRWVILYDGTGVFDLQRVSFAEVASED